jgi:hypothetical protein
MQILQKGLIIALLLSTTALHAQLNVVIQVNQNIQCHGGSDGSLTALVTPVGTAYTFVWSNGGNTATISDLPADTYTVTVQSPTGATAVATAVLQEPEELVLTSLTELPLAVNPSGTVEVETSGGTAPFVYQWVNHLNIPVSDEEDLVDATAGIYTLNATDANGCFAVLSPVTLVTTSNTNELLAAGIRAFPNPVSTTLVLEIPEGEKVQLQVFNSMGQRIESSLLQVPQSNISVEHWPAGCYNLVFPELGTSLKVLVER